MIFFLPCTAFGSWDLAVPSWREPSKLNLPLPFHRRGNRNPDRYAGIWLESFTEKEVPHMGPLLPMDSFTCPKQVTGGLHPPTPPDVLPASPCMGAVAGCRVPGAPRGAPSLWWLSAWAPTSRAHPGFVLMRQPHVSDALGCFLRACMSVYLQIRRGRQDSWFLR